MNIRELSRRITQALRTYKLPVSKESKLQDAIELIFRNEGIEYSREHRLSDTDRPDFFCNGIAIEVKIEGSPAEVTRQVHRYIQHKEVEEVIIVTTKYRHNKIPNILSEKRVTVLWIGGAL